MPSIERFREEQHRPTWGHQIFRDPVKDLQGHSSAETVAVSVREMGCKIFSQMPPSAAAWLTEASHEIS